MNRELIQISILVRDYDEAIEYYTKKLGFKIKEDTDLGDSKRWVLLTPEGAGQTSILLARASTKKQEKTIGNQAGGRVFLFLHTDDFWRDYQEMKDKGVNFIEAPRTEAYGTVVVFEDLYGNKWDLLQHN